MGGRATLREPLFSDPERQSRSPRGRAVGDLAGRARAQVEDDTGGYRHCRGDAFRAKFEEAMEARRRLPRGI
eukprot:2229313-Pyramimonas_sp.AAC.1